MTMNRAVVLPVPVNKLFLNLNPDPFFNLCFAPERGAAHLNICRKDVSKRH